MCASCNEISSHAHANWKKNNFNQSVLQAFSILLAHRSLNHLHHIKCWLEVSLEAFQGTSESCDSCGIRAAHLVAFSGARMCHWKLRQTASIKRPIIGTSKVPCCTSIFFSFPRPPRAEGCRDVPRRIVRNIGQWARCSCDVSVLQTCRPGASFIHTSVWGTLTDIS